MTTRASLREVGSHLGLSALLLALIQLPLYLRLGDAYFLGRADLWGYFGPMAFLMDQVADNGWNPFIFCGTPFAANPQAAVHYPPHLLRSFLVGNAAPMYSMISLYLMQWLHLLLLSLGTWFYLRKQDLSPLAAGTAALLYMTSAALAFRTVQHWQFIAMSAWLPWLLFLLQSAREGGCPQPQVGVSAAPIEATPLRGFRGAFPPSTLRPTLAAGVLFGVTILIGFPQLTLYMSLVLGLFALLHAVLFSRRTRLASLCRATVILAVMVAIGLGVAMPMLLPAYEFGKHTARSKEPGAEAGFLNPKQLDPVADPAALARALSFYPGSNGIRLLGTGGFLLALLSLRHPRRRAVLLHALLFLALLDCCLGPPLPLGQLVALIAPFRVAGPERAAVFAAFFLSVLAAYGLDALRQGTMPSNGLLRHSRASGTPAGGGGGVENVPGRWLTVTAGLLVLLLATNWTLSPSFPVPPLVLAPFVLGLLLLGYMFFKNGSRTLLAIAAVCFVTEQAFWSHHFIHNLVCTNPYPGDTAALWQSPWTEFQNERTTGSKWLENGQLFFLKPAINGYDPLILEPFRQFIVAEGHEKLYNRRVAATEVNPRATSLLRQRIWLLDNIPPAAPPPKSEQVALTERSAEISATDIPGGLRIRTGALAAPASLLLTQPWYPGWSILLNGKAAEPTLFYGLFPTLRLPAGSHEVTLTFASRTVRLGQMIGMLTLASVLTVFFLTLKWRNCRKPPINGV